MVCVLCVRVVVRGRGAFCIASPMNGRRRNLFDFFLGVRTRVLAGALGAGATAHRQCCERSVRVCVRTSASVMVRPPVDFLPPPSERVHGTHLAVAVAGRENAAVRDDTTAVCVCPCVSL